MDRRQLILALSSACAAGPALAQGGSASGVLSRIGVTTVCYRHHSEPAVGKPAEGGPKLTLLTAPDYFKKTFGLTNVEVWNQQFADTSLDYCRRVRSAAAAAGSRVVNLQLDADYHLSSADGQRRADSLKLVKEWMDRAAAIGAPSMRANIDGGRREPLNLEAAAQSFKELAEYGRGIGVQILVENHTGASAVISNVVEVLKAVNHPNCRAILDWGNSRATNEVERIADFSQLFPYLALVSAKGKNFDPAYKLLDYDVGPIVRATEASGFKGIYSIELYVEPTPPADTDAAVRTMLREIQANIRTA